MIIHVKTVGTLKSLQEGTKLEALEVPEKASVSQVLEWLKIQDWEIGFALINGDRVTMESTLRENDTLTLIAPLAGGSPKGAAFFVSGFWVVLSLCAMCLILLGGGRS